MPRVFTFFMLLLPFGCLAQSSATVDSALSKTIISKLQDYSSTHLVEKAYLHFDRPYYAAGDTIYYKAYLTLGGLHKLSGLSGVLHVELVDNIAGKILQAENLEVTSGAAWGDFALPDSMPKGSYKIRAYTQWMRNAGETAFFEQNIPVEPVAASKVKLTGISISANQVSAKPDIQFFPEGGSLATGLRSLVAFKAIGSDGLGLAVKGNVFDNDDKLVGSFESAHLGMGYFFLKPGIGKTYKAQVTYPNGLVDTVNLPAADNKGVILSVSSDSTSNLVIKIKADEFYYAANSNKDYTIAVYSGETLNYIICKLDADVVQLSFSKLVMHPGIARIALFSPTGEPLAERLVFIQNDEQLKLNVSIDKTNYTKRDKVTIKLNALNKAAEPIIGDFSVAVTDESKVPVDENAESTIVNNLLLTSDLKGYVEQPNYYFRQASPEVLANLDLLMLTQGYRRLSWKKVLNNEDSQPPIYQPEKTLTLAGIVKTLAGKPVPRADITLGSVEQRIVRDTTADKNGNFEFDDLYVIDTAKLLLRSGNKNRKIIIKEADYPAITKLANTDSSANRTVSPIIAMAMQKHAKERLGTIKTGILLKQVTIKGDGNPLNIAKLSHSANLNGPGQADQVIMGDKLAGCASLAECLHTLIRAGVRWVADTAFSTRTHIELYGPTPPMAVVVDGIFMDQKSQNGSGGALSMINPEDIYSIEILENPSYLAVYGSEATGGAIIITTRRGDERKVPIIVRPGLTTYTFKGFYKAREFYSPKYEAPNPANSQPDLRSTIYWKPVVITDKDGNASFDFYNADGTGTYRVVVEGIDDKGNIGRQVYEYKVE